MVEIAAETARVSKMPSFEVVKVPVLPHPGNETQFPDEPTDLKIFVKKPILESLRQHFSQHNSISLKLS